MLNTVLDSHMHLMLLWNNTDKGFLSSLFLSEKRKAKLPMLLELVSK